MESDKSEKISGTLAQSVEQETFNFEVMCSNHIRPTI